VAPAASSGFHVLLWMLGWPAAGKPGGRNLSPAAGLLEGHRRKLEALERRHRPNNKPF
jgi:hypothetical protein